MWHFFKLEAASKHPRFDFHRLQITLIDESYESKEPFTSKNVLKREEKMAAKQQEVQQVRECCQTISDALVLTSYVETFQTQAGNPSQKDFPLTKFDKSATWGQRRFSQPGNIFTPCPVIVIGFSSWHVCHLYYLPYFLFVSFTSWFMPPLKKKKEKN